MQEANRPLRTSVLAKGEGRGTPVLASGGAPILDGEGSTPVLAGGGGGYPCPDWGREGGGPRSFSEGGGTP